MDVDLEKRLAAVAGALLVLGGATDTTESAVVSLATQVAVFGLHAWPNASERLYDATGALTHVLIALLAMVRTSRPGTRIKVLSAMSLVWASRLGTFLFTRITRDGGVDKRFESFKNVSALAFAQAWAMQAVWCFVTQLPVSLAARSPEQGDEVTRRDALGWTLWVVGFALEVVADAEKNAHQFAHPGKFISTGLWSWSRHPNLLGEMLLQTGVAVSASSSYRRARDRLGWLSPLFTVYLLTRVSGIPMLEKGAMRRWGKDPAYLEYLARTAVLIPGLY